MDSSTPLTHVDPRPISSPSIAPRGDRGERGDRGDTYRGDGYKSDTYKGDTIKGDKYKGDAYRDDNYRGDSRRPDLKPANSEPAFGMNPPQIPDHPSSTMDVPRMSNGYGGGGGAGPRASDNNLAYGGNNSLAYGGGNTYAPPASTVTNKQRDVPTLKSHCQFGLREYMALQKQRRRVDGAASTSTLDLENRLRHQQGIVISDLMLLHGEVRSIVKKAEGHRWRRWIMGGVIASFVPLIRQIFRRGDDKVSKETSNNTEYAFARSKGLISYIKEGLLGDGAFAKVAFFVLAVLFVFQNEVSLRVAKTVQKRIRRLTARIERGDTDIDEKELKNLEGWRWRVLLW